MILQIACGILLGYIFIVLIKVLFPMVIEYIVNITAKQVILFALLLFAATYTIILLFFTEIYRELYQIQAVQYAHMLLGSIVLSWILYVYIKGMINRDKGILEEIEKGEKNKTIEYLIAIIFGEILTIALVFAMFYIGSMFTERDVGVYIILPFIISIICMPILILHILRTRRAKKYQKLEMKNMK